MCLSLRQQGEGGGHVTIIHDALFPTGVEIWWLLKHVRPAPVVGTHPTGMLSSPLFAYMLIFTARQRSWGKIMFSQACLSTGRGGYPWCQVLSKGWACLVPSPFRGRGVMWRGGYVQGEWALTPTHGAWQGGGYSTRVLISSGRHRSGRYASYCNAFLLEGNWATADLHVGYRLKLNWETAPLTEASKHHQVNISLISHWVSMDYV